MCKYPFILLTGVLFLFLGIPFILKLKETRLESYPAVIFPSGAGKVKTNTTTISPESLELYGYKGRKISNICVENFLDPIPRQYLYTIVEGHFGLAPFKQEFKLYKPPIKFRVTNNYTPLKHKDTKEWIQKRLRSQGFTDSLFLVRHYKNVYHLETRDLISKDLINEEIFKLY